MKVACLIFLQVIASGFGQAIYEDYMGHTCDRICNGNVRICQYNLTIDYFFTMQSDCLRCTSGNRDDCDNSQCIPGDGTQRLIRTVNGYVPGPSIVVCQGDTIEAYVTNLIDPETTTIHWHGIHQRTTPFMDGVPMVTQCPIVPATRFRYRFLASEAGTHFYHSHSGSQRADGMYGHLIVRQPNGINPFKTATVNLYDEDLTEHVISFLDWLAVPADLAFIRYQRTKQFYDDLIRGILVNGFGPTRNNTVPPKRFHVTRGTKYRFRAIHAGNIVCPITLSIDNHKITVISSDGKDINPILTDKLTLTNGERFDFILNANQNEDLYAIRIDGSLICNMPSLAILQYRGAAEKPIGFTNTPRQGTTVNCVNQDNLSNCIQYYNMTSLQAVNNDFRRDPDFKYFIASDNINYVKQRYAGDNAAEELVTPFFNEIDYVPASSPLLTSPDASMSSWCNYENKRNCNGTYCECTHVIPIPTNALVELIFVDLGVLLNLSHPIHLHGYSYRVIGQQKLGTSVDIETVRQMDQSGRLMRNFNFPIIKDTVAVPDGGYTIVRFVANNPGYWLLHCHIDFHSEEGMQIVLLIGNPYGRMGETPRNFPTCGNFNYN